MIYYGVQTYEPLHDKTNKMSMRPAKAQITWVSAQSDQSLRCALPSLIRVFAIRMKKPWVLSYPLSAQRRL